MRGLSYLRSPKPVRACPMEAPVFPEALPSLELGRAHPTGKRFGDDHLRVEPPAHLSDLIFPRLEIQMWRSRDHGSLRFSNNTRFVAADRNGGRHKECRLATALLSNGQRPAPPLRSAKSRRFIGQNEDSRDHVLSNYFAANGPCLPSTPQLR
jgi:hypothetical protein